MSRQCTPVPGAKIAALVTELQAIGDRFEAAGDKRWFTVARAAAILEAIRLGFILAATIPDATLLSTVCQLETIGDRFAAIRDPREKPVVQAASILEGIRLGITAIADDAPTANWFGIDLASGPDISVRADWRFNSHAR
ncbi:hypothetical protein [Dechloromonas denitrificans]|uniref:hypothetical protein n=1 Tax=Dechloromonas denitrificans TaxID=281362 RepID=UPI001CF86B6D|nr:hypothetical protein [Dechloromonas denitrificans]UCV02332.1 hypothetical protein KI611_14700 [Dechloromonas denitrificans]